MLRGQFEAVLLIQRMESKMDSEKWFYLIVERIGLGRLPSGGDIRLGWE